jgi:hypothetical protein
MLTVSQARPTPRASPSAYGSSLPRPIAPARPRRGDRHGGWAAGGPDPRLQRPVYAL